MKYIAMSFWYQPEDNDHSFLFAYVFFYYLRQTGNAFGSIYMHLKLLKLL